MERVDIRLCVVLALILGRSEGSTLFFSCLSFWEESVAHWVVFWVAFRAVLRCCENKNLCLPGTEP